MKRNESSYLEGELLIATPQIQYSCFEKSVIYVCSHSNDGAMGLIINRGIKDVNFPEFLKQFDITSTIPDIKMPMHFGGPVEPARGFILHTKDYKQSATVEMQGDISLTSSVEILRDIAEGKGPKRSLLILGYAGWGPGQLEEEIARNSWITAPTSSDVIFGLDNSIKWQKAGRILGIDPIKISIDIGHA